MKNLKQILIDRINSILQLQYKFFKQPNLFDTEPVTEIKYQLLLQHKKNEKIRSIKQNQILASLNSFNLQETTLAEQLYQHTVQICSYYNNQFAKYREKPTVSMLQNIRRLYCDFFVEHGFKHKCQPLTLALDKDTGAISPAMLLGWLSSWSKKIYCQLLQKQIQKTYVCRQKNFRPIPNSMTVALQRKKSQQFEKDNGTQLSQISLSTRTNIYSYFLEQLQAYYKICGFEGIDHSYLKLIRKRFRKQEFLKPINLIRATDNLIESTANKEISIITKQYYLQYFEKFSKPVPKSLNKIIQNTKKNISLSPVKRRIKNVTQNDQIQVNVGNPSKLLSPKLSQFQFLKPQEIQQKIKKIKWMNQRSIKNNIQFPGVVPKFQIKNQLKLSQNASFNLPISPLKNQQSQQTLKQRLKQKDFLRCQSIKFGCKLKQEFESFSQLTYSSKLQSPTKAKIYQPQQCQSQYDDRKIKIGKIFQLADLKVNKKINSFQRMISGQAQ